MAAATAASEADRRLVAGVLAGHRNDFERLYASCFPRVYRYARKRLGDASQAEDLTQEVFETLLRALPGYRGEASLITWVLGIARNRVNRRFRGGVRRLHPLDERLSARLPGAGVPVDDATDARRMLERCSKVVTRLTPRQRRIFDLKHLRCQPVRAIAEALGMSEATVKTNLHRMRRALVAETPGLAAFLES